MSSGTNLAVDLGVYGMVSAERYSDGVPLGDACRRVEPELQKPRRDSIAQPYHLCFEWMAWKRLSQGTRNSTRWVITHR